MELFNEHTDANNARKGVRLKQVFEMAKPQLNLSAEQEQQVNDIFKNFSEERSGIKDTGGDNMRDDMRTARHDARQQLMAVLNDDQKKIIEESLQNQRDKASE